MGWDNAGTSGSNVMSTQQRNLIIMLREKLDGVSQGTYVEDQLPNWSKIQAMKEVTRLQTKLNERDMKNGIPFYGQCPFCSSRKRPCCEKNPIK